MKKRRIRARPEFGTRLLELGITVEALDRVTHTSVETIRRYMRTTGTGHPSARHTARDITNGVVRLTGRSPDEIFDLLFTEEA